MFFKFESVIPVFPKHSNFKGFFEVIHKEIMQIGKSITSEELWRLRKTKNEDSRGVGDLPEGGILFSSSEASYLKTKT